MRACATLTAMLREASYLQLTPVRASFWVRIPPFGAILLIGAYFAYILALEFVNNNVAGAQHYQALSVRAAWLAIAQVPLLVLLAGKNNVVGLCCGLSYERLRIFHHWIARGLLLLATLHMGFGNYGWSLYGLRQLEWDTDTCPPTGVAVYSIVLWMNLTTLAPFRHYSYEFFAVQHVIAFVCFIIAIMIHIPPTALPARVYIYIPIGIYLVERLLRAVRYLLCNVSPARATLQALDGDAATKIRLSGCRVKTCRPGAHMLLSIPKFGLFQAHPATAISSSSPDDAASLVFILRAHGGFTRRIFDAATAPTSSGPHKGGGSSSSSIANDDTPPPPSYLALVAGPYGPSTSSDFACFDTLFLIAGGTGMTFTTAVLADIARRAKTTRLPLRTVYFVWVVKQRSSLSWIAAELDAAATALRGAGIELESMAFVTGRDAQMSMTTSISVSSSGELPSSDDDDCKKMALETVVRHRGTSKNTTAAEDDEICTLDSAAAMATTANEKLPLIAQQGPWDRVARGRPDTDALLWDGLCAAQGESAIAVCGPLGLVTEVRATVVRLSDERAVHKGTGAQGIYLHVENAHS